MGLYVQSLENIPEVKIHKDCYIYLLDYGWNEPLGETLMKNYENMAKITAENKVFVIRGTYRVHFEDEVLSWHNVNGENAEEKKLEKDLEEQLLMPSFLNRFLLV